MLTEEAVYQKETKGFLLGLGIGLVVGIVFKPRPEDGTSHLRAAASRKVAPRNGRPEREEKVATS